MKNEDYNLAYDMFKNLNAKECEEKTHNDKISIALNHLNKAAELFENMEDYHSTEVLVRIMEKVAFHNLKGRE